MNNDMNSLLEELMNDEAMNDLLSSDDSLFDTEGKYAPKGGYNSPVSHKGYKSEKTAKQAGVEDKALSEQYKSLFMAADEKMKTHDMVKMEATLSNIKAGDMFVIKGHTAIVHSVAEAEYRKSGKNKRVRLMIDNNTETTLLISTLVAMTKKKTEAHRATYKFSLINTNAIMKALSK